MTLNLVLKVYVKPFHQLVMILCKVFSLSCIIHSFIVFFLPWRWYSPLMTGVNTAIPSYSGLLTVISRMRPPILGRGQDDLSVAGLGCVTLWFFHIWVMMQYWIRSLRLMLADLLMDMAKMTGHQPDLRTCLIAGDRRAITIQAGIRSRKNPQTIGGRNHMSVDQWGSHFYGHVNNKLVWIHI